MQKDAAQCHNHASTSTGSSPLTGECLFHLFPRPKEEGILCDIHTESCGCLEQRSWQSNHGNSLAAVAVGPMGMKEWING